MHYIFAYITLFIGIIPLLILLLKKKFFDFKEPIAPFLWLTAFATLYEFFGAIIFKISIDYWSQLYSLLEFIAIYCFFLKLLQPKYKNVVQGFLFLLVAAYFFSFFFWDKNSINFIPKAINKTSLTFFALTFSFLWFKELFRKMENQNPWQNSNFYFVSGFSVYYSSTFFLFLLGRYIFNSDIYFYDYWLINVIATFILRTSLIIGVWKMKQD